jgi:hypothetical protein
MAASDCVNVLAAQIRNMGEVGDRDGSLAWGDSGVEPQRAADLMRRQEALWLAALFFAEPSRPAPASSAGVVGGDGGVAFGGDALPFDLGAGRFGVVAVVAARCGPSCGDRFQELIER